MLVQLPQPNGSWVCAEEVISVNYVSHRSIQHWLIIILTANSQSERDRVEIEMESEQVAKDARDKFAAEVNLALRGESNAIPKQ